jgi:hypothetical protein
VHTIKLHSPDARDAISAKDLIGRDFPSSSPG